MTATANTAPATAAAPDYGTMFQNTVRKTFAFLKQTTDLADLYAKSIAIPGGEGYLVPVCELHADDEPVIALLSKWREEHSFAFPSQFPVTVAGTARWLRARLLDTEDRMLFLVLDRHGKPVGHLGFNNALNDSGSLEVDNVIRGDKGASRGLMSKAMAALITWGQEVLRARSIFLRVFDDNHHALDFYHRLGFTDGKRVPMRRIENGEVVSFEPAEGEAADRTILFMHYTPRGSFDGSRMILTAGPSVSSREVSYTLDAARYGWNTQWSKYLTRFEETFADYLGVRYAMATSSCTGALQIALVALGIGPGDEVIVPDMTWVATANAVLYAGATPVFADIEPDTWCVDPRSIEVLITPRTKAIIAVHLYGHPARVDRIREIADAHGLRFIEDAAPAIGARCNGRMAGTVGDFAAFSFQGAKVAVTGEGGMLVTNDETLFARAHKIWDQGRVPGTFWIDSNGLKFKMSNLQAAFGLAQIERIEEFIDAKRQVFSWYQEGLAGMTHVRMLPEASWARSIYWMSNLIVDEGSPVSRDALREQLRARNVDTRPVFPPISSYPIWPTAPQVKTPVTASVGARGINLPSGVCLKREEVDYVCRAIRDIVS